MVLSYEILFGMIPPSPPTSFDHLYIVNWVLITFGSNCKCFQFVLVETLSAVCDNTTQFILTIQLLRVTYRFKHTFSGQIKIRQVSRFSFYTNSIVLLI